MERDEHDLETPASYRCDLCAETFGAEQELRAHWERLHAGELIGAATDRGTSTQLSTRR
jgi:hypothetical protein